MDSLYRKIATVSELTDVIKILLEQQLSGVWVEGEVSNVRIPASGHIYFTLKDRQSQLKAVLFKYQRLQIPFDIADGMKVVVGGRVSLYPPRGEYQIVISHLEPKGIGSLQVAFEQLKEKLAQEGLFDEEKKKSLPLFPDKIGIVTSKTGAAIHDILHVMKRRFVSVDILICPVKVQGEGAAEEIAQGIKELNKRDDIDIIIVGRGGGSIEDLWAFNEEVVARAVFDSTIPVISAVGHETDFTIADFVADLRAPTPSVAAELAVRDKTAIIEKVTLLKNRLIEVMGYRLDKYDAALRRLRQGIDFHSPERVLQHHQQRVDELSITLEKLFGNRMKKLKNDTRNMMKLLDAVSPLGVLERGYSICMKGKDKKIIKGISSVEVGDLVSVLLSKGSIDCMVEEIKDGQRGKI